MPSVWCAGAGGGVLGGAGAPSHVPRASGSCSRGAGEAASSETLPSETALAQGGAVHRCAVPAWPCWAASPHTQQCLRHRCRVLQGSQGWCPPCGVRPGKPWGAGRCEVVLVTWWPCSSSKARGLVQGWGEAPAGTDTKAAAPRFLHARGCLEETTSSQEQGGGNPAGRDPRD